MASAMAHNYYGGEYKLLEIDDIDAEKYFLRYLALEAGLFSEFPLSNKVKVKRLRKSESSFVCLYSCFC